MTKAIHPMKAMSDLTISRLPRMIVQCLLVLIVLAVFVPLTPVMPSAGLDPSWAYGMNQAVAQHLVFGKDIVFTFGPYASIYTKMYHPATDHMMVFGSLFIGICYAVALLFLTRTVRLVWIVLFGAFLAGGFITIPDSLLLSYPLLLAAVVYRDTLARDETNLSSTPNLSLSVLVLLFAPLGLLPLVKGSFLLISAAVSILSFIELWRLQKREMAYCCLLAPLVAAIVLWLFARQPVLGMPYYFARLIPIISGYSEAMASPGNGKEIVAYLIASVGILLVAALCGSAPLSSRLFLFFSFLLFLFVVFKNGFVRHDGHAAIAGTSLLFAALFLRFAVRNKQSTAVFLLAVFAWAYIDQGYVASSTKSYYQSIRETHQGVTHGLKLRISRGNKLKEMFDHSLQALNDEAQLPTMKGTADIYPDDQAYLLASGNTWSPRPVLQSYSAYTPGLAQLNASHLTGVHAPANVLLNVEPLDRRLPSLEDGPSWLPLLSDYSPVIMDGALLYLAKTSSGRSGSLVEALSTETHNLGETVFLPSAPEPLFAEVDIQLTAIGCLVSFLYKPKMLAITLELDNGTQRTYQLISGMAKAGFVISPLAESTEDFALLFGDSSYWREKRVSAIKISPVGGSSVVWKSKYTVTLSKLRLRPQTDVSALIQLDRVDEEYSKQTEKPATGACDGRIDAVNGWSPPPATATSDRLLSVRGWLMVSARDAVAPDAVFVTLTDEQGKTIYLKTRRTPRSDVKAYLNHPTMPNAGYATYADVSKLDGKYYIGLARTYYGKLEACQQFEIPISINRAK